MCKTCRLTVGILLFGLIGIGNHAFAADTQKHQNPDNHSHQAAANTSDNRIPLHLTESERNIVLAEMRAFLTSVQQIVSAVSKEDIKTIASSARKVGMGTRGHVPASLRKKLPMEFRKLGMDTHRRFDALALDIEQLEDPQHALAQLGELMQNCVACHAAFRIK